MKTLPLSQFAQRMESPGAGVWRVHYEALARQEAGEDIVLMSVGDPDFATPEDIIEKLVTQIRAGRTHYSPAAGELELRQAIADLETSSTGRNFAADNFVILPGATACIYAALACVCDSGDEVIVPEPMYIGYRSMFAALGVHARTVPLELHNQCALDIDRVLAQVNERTRAVLINTPGNPFGNIIPGETLCQLAAALLERGIWLICDEVYSLFTYDEPHVSLLKAAACLDNVVVVDGLSKSHAMTGWRIGWIASPPALNEALSAYCGSAFFGLSQFIQDAAAYALRHNGPHVDHMCEAYRTRRDFVMQRLDEIEVLSYIRPKAGMFMMMNVSQVCNGGDVFADGLLAEQKVSVIPGSGFGEPSDNYVRLSLTHTLDVLDQAMQRIGAYVGHG